MKNGVKIRLKLNAGEWRLIYLSWFALPPIFNIEFYQYK